MKLVLNFSMFLLAFFSFSNESFSLTDYPNKKILRKGEKGIFMYQKFKRKKIRSPERKAN